MKKTATILCALAFLGLGVSSCSDLGDLENDLSDLDGRIEALEARMKSLNESVEAIGALTRATTVNSVTFEDNVYTVVLSDGTELTLTVGEAGVGNVPLITVDDDGFWMVDYRDGKGAVYLTDNGRKFCSTGKDAVTPVFSVDPEGYWMIDYGDGPVHVLDSKGGKVLATSSEETLDPLFEEVVYDKAAGTLTVTLRADGRKISLPVVPDFLLALSNADGLQLFDYGQTKVFPVRSKGVGDAIVQTPLGWSARVRARP